MYTINLLKYLSDICQSFKSFHCILTRSWQFYSFVKFLLLENTHTLIQPEKLKLSGKLNWACIMQWIIHIEYSKSCYLVLLSVIVVSKISYIFKSQPLNQLPLPRLLKSNLPVSSQRHRCSAPWGENLLTAPPKSNKQKKVVAP